MAETNIHERVHTSKGCTMYQESRIRTHGIGEVQQYVRRVLYSPKALGIEKARARDVVSSPRVCTHAFKGEYMQP